MAFFSLLSLKGVLRFDKRLDAGIFLFFFCRFFFSVVFIELFFEILSCGLFAAFVSHIYTTTTPLFIFYFCLGRAARPKQK
jgi:hypothetical protein